MGHFRLKLRAQYFLLEAKKYPTYRFTEYLALYLRICIVHAGKSITMNIKQSTELFKLTLQ
jgi:hypothetical protein